MKHLYDSAHWFFTIKSDLVHFFCSIFSYFKIQYLLIFSYFNFTSLEISYIDFQSHVLAFPLLTDYSYKIHFYGLHSVDNTSETLNLKYPIQHDFMHADLRTIVSVQDQKYWRSSQLNWREWKEKQCRPRWSVVQKWQTSLCFFDIR